MNKRTKIIFGIIGCILIIVFSTIFYKNYNQKLDLDKYILLDLCSVFIALGIELVILIFDVKNVIIKSILLVLLGGFIGTIIYNEYIRTFSLLLSLSVLLFIIIAFTKNIFSTLVTFTISSIPFVFLALVFSKILRSHENIVFYLAIVAFFLFYRIKGEDLNKCFIGRCMGFKHEAEKYNFEQLKEQLNFIYLITFVVLNIGNWFFNSNITVATVLNNAFLTGIAITNITWSKIFWFTKENK